MDIIRFNTGRGYTAQGQLIEARVISREYDEDFDCEFFKVKFVDTARDIAGIVTTSELSEAAIMRQYDNCHYQLCRSFDILEDR